jgi:hypothetical protein
MRNSKAIILQKREVFKFSKDLGREIICARLTLTKKQKDVIVDAFVSYK